MRKKKNIKAVLIACLILIAVNAGSVNVSAEGIDKDTAGVKNEEQFMKSGSKTLKKIVSGRGRTMGVFSGQTTGTGGTAERHKRIKNYYDKPTVYTNEQTGEVLGVVIERFLRTNTWEDILVQLNIWDAQTGSWSYIDNSGKEQYFSEEGPNALLGNQCWNLIIDKKTGVSKATGGYGFQIKYGHSGRWQYYLTDIDVKTISGLAELHMSPEGLPAEFFIGAEGDSDSKKHSGLRTVRGDKYFLVSGGIMYINKTRVINGMTYFFGPDGKLQKTYIPEEAKWVKLGDGHYYWKQEDGEILRQGGFHKINGKWYYLNPRSGRRIEGWFEYDHRRYHFDEETGVMSIGFCEINGERYLFNSGDQPLGAMAGGWKYMKEGKRYFDYSTGIMQKGWLHLAEDVYYLNEKSGIMKKGLSTINGKKYYFEKNGKQRFGWRSIGGKKYYFDRKTGEMKKNCWVTEGKNKYYLNKNGTQFRGIRSIGHKNYYFKQDGKLVTDVNWYEINGKYYNIDRTGVMTEIFL